MKKFFSSCAVAFLLLPIFPTSANATTAEERAQAFVCGAIGKCMLPYGNHLVQRALRDLAEIENDCRETRKSVVSVPDRFGFARAYLDKFQDLQVLMTDFKPIARKHCASNSLDDMLNAYTLERNKTKASHSDVIAALLANPKPLLRKWRGKQARGSN